MLLKQQLRSVWYGCGLPIEHGGSVALEAKSEKLARYNLALPKDLYVELQEVAREQGMTVLQLLRRFITLGLTLLKIQRRSPNAAILIRDGDTETQILLI